MLVSIPDSYFSYVARRLQTLNARVVVNGVSIPQPIGGMLDAKDWPQTQIVEGALYLLIQRLVPGGVSWVQRQYCCYAQWSWILIGANTGATQQSANRGDRYRQSMQIMQNLTEASYPGFCQKMSYSSDVNGVMSALPAASTYPVSQTQMIFWDALKFNPRVDQQASGVEYGVATVELSGWDDVQAAAGLDLAGVMGAQLEA